MLVILKFQITGEHGHDERQTQTRHVKYYNRKWTNMTGAEKGAVKVFRIMSRTETRSDWLDFTCVHFISNKSHSEIQMNIVCSKIRTTVPVGMKKYHSTQL